MPASRTRHLCSVAAALALTVAGPATAASAATAGSDGLREVMFVGNNWDGTADVIRSTGDFAKIGRIDVVPDKAERLAEINADPIKWIYYTSIRNEVGQGHDQYVDDMYSTPDGRSVVVSRPSFADVVSIDLATGKVNWRFPVAGYRADHMALSPDGTRVAVSASTANKVQVLDIDTGKELGEFATGDKPHENFFTDGGKYIWNMSIGEVTTSLDDPGWDWTKGDRHITIVDATTFKQVRTIDMRQRLDAIGLKDFSSAIRPAAFTPDWSKLYFQVSFFNGFLEYDVAADRITRVKTLPANPATNPDRTTWLLDSRHHGISMNPEGTKLCVAGTMDNYATVVDRASFDVGPHITASTPYWATVSGDGKDCIISEAGADQVTAIDFATGQKVLSVPVGDHPQRVRLGHVQADWTGPTGS
ncbi:serine/threonine protein kinase [Streptomyces sp. MUSC 14]|uniref:YncE family protein n=1 Tax=Streptomyces sp. MUSC 14 TaxID=1354889 RepID=UPI0008F55D62|nr:PQQ-binding-like beta-propeller repeat protein [Streptomyces sp. MUSC 14]OIK00366.1 serine/threonine protein kinase [Streptomyces sp. MUSC 14]